VTDEGSLLARLTRRLADTRPAAPLPRRLVVALSEVLAMDGGAITIGYAPTERATVCATTPLAQRIEELQDVFREGPSLDAHRSAVQVVSGSRGQRAQWPMLMTALTEEHPSIRLFAVPMMPDRSVLGVVSLYRLDGAGEPVDGRDAQFLVDAIGIAVLGGFDRSEPGDLVWTSRDRVNQATGMVVAQLRIAPEDALALLRAHAFAHGVTLVEVAGLVVSRELDFRLDDDGRGEA
jgi:hypothetical protein